MDGGSDGARKRADVQFPAPADAEAGESVGSPAETLLSRPARRNDERPLLGMPGVVTATILGAADDGRPLVAWAAGPATGVAAQPIWMSEPPRWADCAGLRAVIGFEDGDTARPLLLGLLQAPPGPRAEHAESPVEKRSGEPGRHLELSPQETPDEKPASTRIESGEELVLQCGEAKIVLRADGSVTILGTKIVSRARGVHKIKGGSVQIN